MRIRQAESGPTASARLLLSSDGRASSNSTNSLLNPSLVCGIIESYSTPQQSRTHHIAEGHTSQTHSRPLDRSRSGGQLFVARKEVDQGSSLAGFQGAARPCAANCVADWYRSHICYTRRAQCRAHGFGHSCYSFSESNCSA